MKIYSKRLYGQMVELTDVSLHLEALDWIDRLGPWGQKFPIPNLREDLK